jgi:dihydropteroate synthase
LQTIQPKITLNCGGVLLSLEKAVVMGILNLTPDSFYTDSRVLAIELAIQKTAKMIEAGAKIIDLGAQSTRPGAQILTVDEEKKRLNDILPELLKSFPTTIFSIDTFYRKTAEFAVHHGVQIINDVAAFELDESLYDFVVEAKLPYILMHPGNHFNNKQFEAEDIDVLNKMIEFFLIKVNRLQEAGHTDIILDPGFGFGKNLNQNVQILKNLSALGIFKLPILAGLSRKSMIRQLAQTNTEEALTGTIVANTIALLNGAKILRVHDVLEAVQSIQMLESIRTI